VLKYFNPESPISVTTFFPGPSFSLECGDLSPLSPAAA
jgi:hypothetical protein